MGYFDEIYLISFYVKFEKISYKPVSLFSEAGFFIFFFLSFYLFIQRFRRIAIRYFAFFAVVGSVCVHAAIDNTLKNGVPQCSNLNKFEVATLS